MTDSLYLDSAFKCSRCNTPLIAGQSDRDPANGTIVHRDVAICFNALRAENERLKKDLTCRVTECNELNSAYQFKVEQVYRLRAENERLRKALKHAAKLSEIVRRPNIEWVADEHNAAVAALRAALEQEQKDGDEQYLSCS